MYGKFKRDFVIKNNLWPIIWTWPKACAPAVIRYLEDKYNNTIKGKIEKAASRKGYIHTRPQLYKKEKELLAHLGLEMNSPEVRQFFKEFFGTTSHTKITHLEHWQFVSYLEGIVKGVTGTGKDSFWQIKMQYKLRGVIGLGFAIVFGMVMFRLIKLLFE